MFVVCNSIMPNLFLANISLYHLLVFPLFRLRHLYKWCVLYQKVCNQLLYNRFVWLNIFYCIFNFLNFKETHFVVSDKEKRQQRLQQVSWTKLNILNRRSECKNRTKWLPQTRVYWPGIPVETDHSHSGPKWPCHSGLNWLPLK